MHDTDASPNPQQSARPTTPPVRGFHGTSAPSAEIIVRKGFVPKHNPNHWLGRGVYFFERDAERAKLWCSLERQGAVLAADISLEACFDLTTMTDQEEFHIAAHALDELLTDEEFNAIKQEGHLHGLDYQLTELAVANLVARGRTIDVVRASVQGESNTEPIATLSREIDGQPIELVSTFLKENHIQLCVRNQRAISNVELLAA